MLCDSVVAVAVVRTRPRAIPLAMITMRKSTHGFSFLSNTSMGLLLVRPFLTVLRLQYNCNCIAFYTKGKFTSRCFFIFMTV